MCDMLTMAWSFIIYSLCLICNLNSTTGPSARAPVVRCGLNRWDSLRIRVMVSELLLVGWVVYHLAPGWEHSNGMMQSNGRGITTRKSWWSAAHKSQRWCPGAWYSSAFVGHAAAHTEPQSARLNLAVPALPSRDPWFRAPFLVHATVD